jgi:hypothetical protein
MASVTLLVDSESAEEKRLCPWMDGMQFLLGAKNCRWRSFTFLVYPLTHEFHFSVMAARQKQELQLP